MPSDAMRNGSCGDRHCHFGTERVSSLLLASKGKGSGQLSILAIHCYIFILLIYTNPMIYICMVCKMRGRVRSLSEKTSSTCETMNSRRRRLPREGSGSQGTRMGVGDVVETWRAGSGTGRANKFCNTVLQNSIIFMSHKIHGNATTCVLAVGDDELAWETMTRRRRLPRRRKSRGLAKIKIEKIDNKWLRIIMMVPDPDSDFESWGLMDAGIPRSLCTLVGGSYHDLSFTPTGLVALFPFTYVPVASSS